MPCDTDNCSENLEKNNPLKIVAALKQVTSKRIELTKQLEDDIFKLQVKYSEQFHQIQEDISSIANGERDIVPDDYAEIIKTEDSDEIWESLRSSVPFVSPTDKVLKDYWLVVMKNSDAFEGIITETDEAILKFLRKVNVVYSYPESPYVPPVSVPKDSMFESNGVAIEFHFDKNDFFTNETLFKFYKLGFFHQGEEVWEFDGLKAVECIGSKIDWNPGRDVTVKKISKKRRNKRTGKVDVREVTERCESFFRFFSSDYRELEVKDEQLSEEEAIALRNTFIDADYDLGCFIINSMIPRSVLYYLNEVECDYSDEDADDDDDENDQSESSENDYNRPTYNNSPFKKNLNPPPHGMRCVDKKGEGFHKGPSNKFNGSGGVNKK